MTDAMREMADLFLTLAARTALEAAALTELDDDPATWDRHEVRQQVAQLKIFTDSMWHIINDTKENDHANDN